LNKPVGRARDATFERAVPPWVPPRDLARRDNEHRRIGLADDLNASTIHSFRELMSDYADELPDHFYWRAFEELEAQGHLHPASHKEFGGGACGRLSADGRLYLRASGDPGPSG
jgi:hypothetical protein